MAFRELISLRAAMNVYAFIAERKGCPPEAAAEGWLRDFAGQLDLSPALSRHAALHGRPAEPSFRITAVRSGEHEYTSQQVAAWAGYWRSEWRRASGLEASGRVLNLPQRRLRIMHAHKSESLPGAQSGQRRR